MEEGAGRYFEIRMRLRSQLARQHWTLGKPFSASQEDAWMLLNEVDEIIKVLEKLALQLPTSCNPDLASQVRHTLLMHQPAWKSDRNLRSETSEPV